MFFILVVYFLMSIIFCVIFVDIEGDFYIDYVNYVKVFVDCKVY